MNLFMHLVKIVVLCLIYFPAHFILKKYGMKDAWFSAPILVIIAYFVPVLTNFIDDSRTTPNVIVEIVSTDNRMMLKIKSSRFLNSLTMNIPVKGQIKLKETQDRNNASFGVKILEQVKGLNQPNSFNRYEIGLEKVLPNRELQYEIYFEPMIGIPPFLGGAFHVVGDDAFTLSYTWSVRGDAKFKEEVRSLLTGKKVPEPGVIISDLKISTPHNEFIEGINLIKQKRYQDAENYFSEKIKSGPANYLGFAYRGKCLMKLGDYKKANADFTQALSLNRDAGVFFSRAEVLMKLGHFDAAILDYNAGLALNYEGENIERVFFDRGICYLEMNNLTSAEKDFSKAIEINPSFLPAYFNKASVLEKQGKLKEAADYYSRYVKARGVKDPKVLEKALNKVASLTK